ncbi:pyocin knob domain-containing protein [Pseudomonas protegens]|uniref:pyocin knob domain-containing protein n=1 Tax=Pseudomonas protegens TaxID=380021 RepID=UPI000F4AC811|nr:pyocin knob domain-containing protein [Pseudomonas protegens]MDP9504501.1 pyocin knob domain-containing protein [Pseudomonas protegens]
MARQEINLGVLPNGVGGDTPRVANTKINDMTAELYTAIEEGGGKVQTVAGVEPDAEKDVPKAELATALGVDDKVDKVEGKGLSTNDFTTPEKTKLASMVNAASYGVGAPAPFLDNIYQVKDGGITYWNQSTTGRPPEGGQGNLISMTGGNNGSASTFIATSLNEDKVFFGRVNGATRPPWKQFLLAGDFGVGAKDNAVFAGTSLNPDDYVAGGYVTGQFSINGTNFTGCLITQAGSNSSTCSQQFTDWNGGRYYTRSKSGGVWKSWATPLLTGEYGLGSKGEAINYLADANVPPASGKARVHPETANGPGVYGTLEQSYLDTGSWTQTVTSIIDGTVFARSKASWLPNPTGWVRQTPEFISNANGSAIKFPDGTLICYAAASTKTITNIPLGAIFTSDQRLFNFPVPFVVEPIVTWSSSSSSNGVCWGNCEWSSTTQTVGRLNSAFSTIDGYLRYIAIGRWK